MRDPLHLLGPFWEKSTDFILDDYLFWRMRPGLKLESMGQEKGQIPINNMGLRGYDFDTSQYPNYIRVLCVGDSCTFSWEVPYGDGYSERIEHHLSGTLVKRPVKVINAGVSAYSSFQVLRMYKKVVDLFNPEIVVAWMGTNDVSYTYSIPDKEVAKRYTRTYYLRYLISHSYFLSYLDNIYYQYRSKNIPPEELVALAQKRQIKRVSLEDSEANILSLLKECRKRHQILILVNRQHYTPAPELDRYNQMLKKLSLKESIPLVDVDSILSDSRQKTYYNNAPHDPCHLNQKGYDLVAQMTSKEIIKAYMERGGK